MAGEGASEGRGSLETWRGWWTTQRRARGYRRSGSDASSLTLAIGMDELCNRSRQEKRGHCAASTRMHPLFIRGAGCVWGGPP